MMNSITLLTANEMSHNQELGVVHSYPLLSHPYPVLFTPLPLASSSHLRLHQGVVVTLVCLCSFSIALFRHTLPFRPCHLPLAVCLFSYQAVNSNKLIIIRQITFAMTAYIKLK